MVEAGWVDDRGERGEGVRGERGGWERGGIKGGREMGQGIENRTPRFASHKHTQERNGRWKESERLPSRGDF